MTALLSTTAWWGIPALILLFVLCFFGVHIALLAMRGFFASELPPENQPPQEKKPEPQPQPEPEPIYYIVEKKRKSKPSYSVPKQIKFK